MRVRLNRATVARRVRCSCAAPQRRTRCANGRHTPSKLWSTRLYPPPASGDSRRWPTRSLSSADRGPTCEGTVIAHPDSVSVNRQTPATLISNKQLQTLPAATGEGKDYTVQSVIRKTGPVRPPYARRMPRAEDRKVPSAQGKITLKPGSARLDSSPLGRMDKIAEILKDCRDIANLRCQLITDKPRPREMNLALSQSRAQSVVERTACPSRDTGSRGQGYAKTPCRPLKTAKRPAKANRRIEIKLNQ